MADMRDEELDRAVSDFGTRGSLMQREVRKAGRQIKSLHVAAGPCAYLIIYALCNDGTLWSRSPFGSMPEERHWDRVEDIPIDP